MSEKMEKSFWQKSKETLPEKLYEQPLKTGMSSITIEKGVREQHLFGPVFEVGGIDYLQPEDEYEDENTEDETEEESLEEFNEKLKKYKGPPFELESKKIVTDRTIIEKIRDEIEKNEAIKEARVIRAEELSQGDGLLERVLLDNMYYKNGDADSDPLILEGINFYQVGRNASHEFYMGTKDGKKYICNIEPGETDKVYMEEVENWEGRYYGHY